MYNDFNSVEAELREIEQDFASGRMNAFGSSDTQDALLREFKRIAEIETHIFYKTCTILKASSSAEHSILTTMFASALPPRERRAAGSAEDSTFRSNCGSAPGQPYTAYDTPSPLSSKDRTGTKPRSMSPVSPAGASPRRDNWSGPSCDVESGGAAASFPASHWGNETGFADKAFEDVDGHFRLLEGGFTSLANSLHQMSQHVIRLNDMSAQLEGTSMLPRSAATTSATTVARDKGDSRHD